MKAKIGFLIPSSLISPHFSQFLHHTNIILWESTSCSHFPFLYKSNPFLRNKITFRNREGLTLKLEGGGGQGEEDEEERRYPPTPPPRRRRKGLEDPPETPATPPSTPLGTPAVNMRRSREELWSILRLKSVNMWCSGLYSNFSRYLASCRLECAVLKLFTPGWDAQTVIKNKDAQLKKMPN